MGALKSFEINIFPGRDDRGACCSITLPDGRRTSVKPLSEDEKIALKVLLRGHASLEEINQIFQPSPSPSSTSEAEVDSGSVDKQES